MTSPVGRKPAAPAPAQPKAPGAKKSINEIIHHYWKEHMLSQGLDPNNPPPRDPNEKQWSFVGQPCGFSQVVEARRVPLLKKEDVAKPCGQPQVEKRKLDDAQEPEAKKVTSSEEKQ